MRVHGKRVVGGDGVFSSPRHFLARCVLIMGVLALLAGMLMTGVCLSASSDGAGATAFLTEGKVSDRIGMHSPHIYWDPYDANGNGEMEKEFQYMQDAGIMWMRCSLPWIDIETSQGTWNWAKMDMMVQKAQAHGIKILGILVTAPKWANGGYDWTPLGAYPPDTNNPASMDLWKDYVGRICTRYRDYIDAWEVWNEEDLTTGWYPTPDVAAYVKVLAAASNKIHEVDSDDFVVLGGLGGARPEVMEQYLAAGVADYIDAIAYHPYPCTWSSAVPDEVGCRNMVNTMHNLIKTYTTKDLQIWLTELGFSTSGYPTSFPVDEPTQASYIMRTMLLYSALDVDKIFYHSMKDEIPGIWFVYDTSGILNVDPNRPLGPTGGYPYAITNPKTSYYYYQTMEGIYGNAVSQNPGAVSYTCNNAATLETFNFILPDGDLAIAAWKTDGVADSLNFTVANPSYEKPQSVNPVTGARSDTPGYGRDAQGRVTVSALPIGVVNSNPALTNNPVIIVLNRGSGVAISSITPNSGTQNTVVNVTSLVGGGFQNGAAVRLELSGQPTITATNVKVIPGGTEITCTFDLTNAAAGAYDVVVTNPPPPSGDGLQGRLVGGFTVSAAACGAGAAASMMVFGIMMGIMSLAGVGGLRRRLRKRVR